MSDLSAGSGGSPRIWWVGDQPIARGVDMAKLEQQWVQRRYERNSRASRNLEESRRLAADAVVQARKISAAVRMNVQREDPVVAERARRRAAKASAGSMGEAYEDIGEEEELAGRQADGVPLYYGLKKLYVDDDADEVEGGGENCSEEEEEEQQASTRREAGQTKDNENLRMKKRRAELYRTEVSSHCGEVLGEPQ